MSEWWLLAGVLFFIFCSGCISASQVALFSLSSTEVQSYRQSQDRKERLIYSLLSHPRQLLVTLFMVDVLINLFVQNFSAQFFGAFSSFWVNVAVPLVLTLVFGEILPKSYALSRVQRIVSFVSPGVYRLFLITRPLRLVLVAVASFVSRTLFFFLKKSPELSKEEVLNLLRSEKTKELLDPQEGLWILGYLWLQSATAKEIMQPRDELVIYSLLEPLEKLAQAFESKKAAHVICCRETLDEPVGILSAKDYFLIRTRLTKPEDLLQYFKQVWFIPEHTKARSLLAQHKDRSALVVDEYSSVRGLVTREDLLEGIFGKRSLPQSKEEYLQVSPTTVIISGALEIKVLEQLFQVSLKNPYNMVTVGGWVASLLGRIPQAGEQALLEPLFVNVLAAEPRRIQKLYLRKEK